MHSLPMHHFNSMLCFIFFSFPQHSKRQTRYLSLWFMHHFLMFSSFFSATKQKIRVFRVIYYGNAESGFVVSFWFLGSHYLLFCYSPISEEVLQAR